MKVPRNFAPIVALVFLAAPGNAGAQKLSDPAIKGVAVVKKNSHFRDDQAIGFEFTHFYVEGRSSTCVVPGGRRVNFRDNQELFIVPYPGRGHAETLEEVELLLRMAHQRFPQYRQLWRNLEIAWRKEFARPPAELMREREEMARHHLVAEEFRRSRNQMTAVVTNVPKPANEPSRKRAASSPRGAQALPPGVVLDEPSRQSSVTLLGGIADSEQPCPGELEANDPEGSSLLHWLREQMDLIRRYYQGVEKEKKREPAGPE